MVHSQDRGIRSILSTSIFLGRWPDASGVNGKLVIRISFRLGRNDEIRKEHLSTGY